MLEEATGVSGGDGGAGDCDSDGSGVTAALTLSSLVLLCKVGEEFTCPGREEAELEFPVCCTSGGVGLGGLVGGLGVGMGIWITGGDVLAGGEYSEV